MLDTGRRRKQSIPISYRSPVLRGSAIGKCRRDLGHEPRHLVLDLRMRFHAEIKLLLSPLRAARIPEDGNGTSFINAAAFCDLLVLTFN